MKRLVIALVLAVLCFASNEPAQDNGDNTRPDLKLWSALKRSLTGPDGEEFFRQNMKDTVLPPMMGTLISSMPAEHPTILVLAVSDASTPEITLRVKDDSGKDAPLNGPVLRGSQIRFEGAATAYTKEPFMVTIEASPKLRRLRKR